MDSKLSSISSKNNEYIYFRNNSTWSWQKSFHKSAAPGLLTWNLDGGYPVTYPLDPDMQPSRVMVSGEAYGLGVELFLNNSEHQYACDGNSLGFTVSLFIIII